MEESNSLVFESLDLIEIPVTIGKAKYTLREATSGAVRQYRSEQIACSRLGPDGKPIQIIGVASTDLTLLSLCLFDQYGQVVPVHVVSTWPEKIVKPLIEKLKKISELEESNLSLQDQRKAAVKNLAEIDESIAKTEKTEKTLKNEFASTVDTTQ